MEGINPIWAAAGLGFLASLHCVLMCGPLALAIPIGQLSRPRQIWSRIFFVVGRWGIYMVMGGLVGALGQPVSWLGFQELFLWIAVVLFFSIVTFWEKDFLISFRQKLQVLSRKLIDRQPFTGFLVLGMANGLLPCGMVYAALALAVISGTVWMGALTMILFGMANSWWHLVLIFRWRIPRLNVPGLAFLSSNRVAMIAVLLALVFRIGHTLEGHVEKTDGGVHKNAPTEKELCRRLS